MQALNTVRALTLGGYKVTVLCLFRHIASVVENYKNCGAKVYCACPQYNDYGIEIAYPQKLKLLFFLYKHLTRVIRNEKVDIVHVQYMTPGAMVILLLWLMGVKNIIATAHTAADIYKDLRLIHFIQRHCVRAWICITERAEHSFFGSSQLYSKDMVLGKRNHFTIYNALGEFSVYRLEFSDSFPFALQTENGKPEQRDLTKHERSASLNTKQERSVIGVVSRLEPIKGMDLVVPAFAEVRKRFPDVQLLVVGDGSLRAAMEQQAMALGCDDAVTWAGRQPQEELSQYYSRMDIVLMPSRSEGFGLTAIEAMAHGCVVVASDIGGLPEVVRDGVCGLLHRSEDVRDMAEKICSLIASSELYRSLQKNALQHVQKFSFQRYASAVCDLYERLIAT